MDFKKRNSLKEPRVHKELKQKARERLTVITNFLGSDELSLSLDRMMEDHGISIVEGYIKQPIVIAGNNAIDNIGTHKNIMMNAPKSFVFSYIERIMNYKRSRQPKGIKKRERKIKYDKKRDNSGS